LEVRKAVRDDWSSILKLYSVVYTSPRSEFEPKDDDAVDIAHTWGVFDGGKPVSVLMSHEFEMMHDGAAVPIAGIGGVGTLPEHRRRGHVRRLFQAAFAEMRERGQVFTTLFPFSYPYYRMFGYELVYSRDHYTLPLAALDPAGRTGRLESVEPAAPEVRELYDRFARRNLSMRRSDRWWRQHARVSPYRDQVFTYVYRDEDDRPRGYLTLHVGADESGENHVTVRDLAFQTDAVLPALLAHLGVLYPHAKRVSLRVPTDVPIDLLVPDPEVINHRRSPAMMGRVVDARPALAATRWEGSGELVVRVNDGTPAAKPGTYRVEWGDGSAHVTERGGTPDLSVDARTLVQLLCGYVDGGTALRLGLVESRRDPGDLASVFPAKPLYQNDAF